jgi:hypothetical protein
VTALTKGQRNTLEAIAYVHRYGFADYDGPGFYHPRGAQHRLCKRWRDEGLLVAQWCSAADSDEAKEIWCYGFTPKGVEWALALGVSLSDNTCEHGDHEAPHGKRFCSDACMRCEGESEGDTGCDGICGGEGRQ